MSTNAVEERKHGESVPNRSRWKHRLGVLVVLALAVGSGGIALFGPTPRVAEGILVATADIAEASGYRQEGEISAEAALAATATKLQSNCNVTATHSSASSTGDRMFARTLAIYNLDDDLLMQRIGLALFERLRDQGRFRQIRYLPAGERLPDGERLPEVFVTLEKRSWEESGLPGVRQFEGEIVVTASDQFRRSNHSHLTSLSPPQVQYHWRAEVRYTAKQTGIETSGARYQAVSRDLAKEISERVTKLLDDLSSKHGIPGELPGEWYPEYIEPPAFDFLADLDAEKWIDGPEFMSHSVAVWQTSDDHTPRQVTSAINDSLKAAGWNVPESDSEPEYLRATKGSQVVVAFRENAGRMIEGKDADSPTRMFIVYRREMPSGAIDEALRTMLVEGADESSLLMFQNAWYRQRELVDEYFTRHAPGDAESWLQLARLRKSSDPGAAREALQWANALQLIVHQKSPDSAMKKLAEELGMPELPRQISREMVELLGFEELWGPGEIEVTVRENQPAVIGLSDGDEEQTWLLLTAIRRNAIYPESTLQIQMLKIGKGTWSRSDQIGGDLMIADRPVYAQRVGAGQELQVFSEPLEGGRYRLTLRRSGPASGD